MHFHEAFWRFERSLSELDRCSRFSVIMVLWESGEFGLQMFFVYVRHHTLCNIFGSYTGFTSRVAYPVQVRFIKDGH